MTTISAKVIADSHNGYGNRLTTLQLRYPRWIHAEGRTHRVLSLEEERTPSLMEARELSRNASSSRAIPVKTLIQDVVDDPAVPLFWGKNQKGMQATEECTASIFLPDDLGHMAEYSNEEAWLKGRDEMIKLAMAYDAAGYHKQVVNRLLEPFSHINVLVSATEWDNFFALRIHKDAEPHIQLLATRMKEAMDTSEPKLLTDGEPHLPYIEQDDWDQYPQDWIDGGDGYSYGDALGALLKVSTARCARVSYLTHDGLRTSHDSDIELHDKLVASEPLHASPAEHQAFSDPYRRWPNQHGNFRGFRQYRKMLPGECVKTKPYKEPVKALINAWNGADDWDP